MPDGELESKLVTPASGIGSEPAEDQLKPWHRNTGPIKSYATLTIKLAQNIGQSKD